MNAAERNNQAVSNAIPFTQEIANQISSTGEQVSLIAEHMSKIYLRADETDQKIESTAQMLNDKIDAVPEAVVSRAEVRRTENRVNALEDKMHVISGKLKIDWTAAI